MLTIKKITLFLLMFIPTQCGLKEKISDFWQRYKKEIIIISTICSAVSLSYIYNTYAYSNKNRAVNLENNRDNIIINKKEMHLPSSLSPLILKKANMNAGKNEKKEEIEDFDLFDYRYQSPNKQEEQSFYQKLISYFSDSKTVNRIFNLPSPTVAQIIEQEKRNTYIDMVPEYSERVVSFIDKNHRLRELIFNPIYRHITETDSFFFELLLNAKYDFKYFSMQNLLHRVIKNDFQNYLIKISKKKDRFGNYMIVKQQGWGLKEDYPKDRDLYFSVLRK